MKIMLL